MEPRRTNRRLSSVRLNPRRWRCAPRGVAATAFQAPVLKHLWISRILINEPGDQSTSETDQGPNKGIDCSRFEYARIKSADGYMYNKGYQGCCGLQVQI